jgi:hypothetical protein
MSDRTSEILNSLLKGQEAVRKATTFVEWEKDDNRPGRTKYRIHGPRQGIQQAIDRLMATTEDLGGFVNFIGPYRKGDAYEAVGEVIETAALEEPVH